jgi:hypothetical protein
MLSLRYKMAFQGVVELTTAFSTSAINGVRGCRAGNASSPVCGAPPRDLPYYLVSQMNGVAAWQSGNSADYGLIV